MLETGGFFMQERRQARRRADITITVHQCIQTLLGRETWLAAKAIDLSAEGVSLVMNESLNAGENIYLLTTVTMEGKEPRDLEVNGVTTHCRQTEDGRWRVGLKFIDLAPWEKEDWAEFLKE